MSARDRRDRSWFSRLRAVLTQLNSCFDAENGGDEKSIRGNDTQHGQGGGGACNGGGVESAAEGAGTGFS